MDSFEDLEDLCTVTGDPKAQQIKGYPTKADMKVATRTLICKIGTHINIEKVIEKVKLESGKIEKVKFGNKKDVEEITKNYLKDVSFHYVKNMLEVIDFALLEEKVANPVNMEIVEVKHTAI